MRLRAMIALLGLFITLPLFGQSFDVTYQGRLLENGQPVNGTRNIVFEIHNTEFGGLPLFAGMRTVSVQNGLFATTLSLSSFLFNDGLPRYLQLSVQGQLLGPRTLMSWAPRAIYSHNTRGLVVENTGQVGIGRTSAQAALHLTPIGSSNEALILQNPATTGVFMRLRSNVATEWLLGTNGSASGAQGGNLVLRNASSPVDLVVFGANANVGFGGPPVNPANRTRNVSIQAPGGAENSAGLTLAAGAIAQTIAGTSLGDLDLFLGGQLYARFYRAPNGGSMDLFGGNFNGVSLRLTTSSTGGVLNVSDNSGLVQVSASVNNQGQGDVNADRFVAGVKFFRIDHPLDPENRELYHASVESDRMLNLYDGTVVTDANGFATVTLPDWFEALNTDARVQLTVVDEGDDFVLAKVAGPINGNQFRVRTSKPNITVNWLVTGVRHDAFARKFPMQVEAEKTGEEKGRLIHPEAFDVPADREDKPSVAETVR